LQRLGGANIGSSLKTPLLVLLGGVIVFQDENAHLKRKERLPERFLPLLFHNPPTFG